MCETDSSIQADAGVPFKRCTACAAVWLDRDAFLSDPDVRLLGYQPHFEALTAGLILFNHLACGTTLGLEVAVFESLHTGTVFSRRLDGTAACPGYCQHASNFRPCPLQCECAWVRQVLARIRTWPKRDRSGSPSTPG